MTTLNKNGLIEKSSFVNGNPEYMTSFRGESYGINDLVCYLVQAGFYNKKITIPRDNEAVVKN